jgi:hypothetical protein
MVLLAGLLRTPFCEAIGGMPTLTLGAGDVDLDYRCGDGETYDVDPAYPRLASGRLCSWPCGTWDGTARAFQVLHVDGAYPLSEALVLCAEAM